MGTLLDTPSETILHAQEKGLLVLTEKNICACSDGLWAALYILQCLLGCEFVMGTMAFVQLNACLCFCFFCVNISALKLCHEQKLVPQRERDNLTAFETICVYAIKHMGQLTSQLRLYLHA